MPKPQRCHSTMSEMSAMQRIRLADDYEISRVIRGGWQMATGHGAVRSDDPVGDMVAFADAGITTFDCADIYTGVEELIGRFRLAYRDLRGEEALRRIKVHTKFVPDLDILPTITKAYVQRGIDESLRRLRLERLDLVQFHWWTYDAPRWLETAQWLEELRRAGKIHKVSATNFDTDRMLALLTGGVPLTSMQLQYSLLDTRPARRMVEAAADNGVSLLCYGTVAGGFLGDRWLGQPAPSDAVENRSLTKYRLIIDDLGGWDLFQDLLRALRADRRPASGRHRHDRQRRRAGPAGRRGGDRRGADPDASGRQSCHRQGAVEPRGSAADRRRAGAGQVRLRATFTPWSAAVATAR